MYLLAPGQNFVELQAGEAGSDSAPLTLGHTRCLGWAGQTLGLQQLSGPLFHHLEQLVFGLVLVGGLVVLALPGDGQFLQKV